MSGYQEDLAYIHDVGFGGFALQSAPGLLDLLRRYGLTQGLSLDNAARLGCKVGSEVVQVMGAVIPDAGWQRVHQYRNGLAAAAG